MSEPRLPAFTRDDLRDYRSLQNRLVTLAQPCPQTADRWLFSAIKRVFRYHYRPASPRIRPATSLARLVPGRLLQLPAAISHLMFHPMHCGASPRLAQGFPYFAWTQWVLWTLPRCPRAHLFRRIALLLHPAPLGRPCALGARVPQRWISSHHATLPLHAPSQCASTALSTPPLWPPPFSVLSPIALPSALYSPSNTHAIRTPHIAAIFLCPRFQPLVCDTV
ncbi:hypothetical protein DFH09DRAFT_295860 [Mycena vulgaris]|nr:hypothetical protein DFH09DRAFT_295860 [Mycena vulgaris]